MVTPSTRGLLGTGFQIMCNVGILFEICFGTFLEWNTISYVSILPPILCSIGMFFAPESPIRLIETNDHQGARRQLAKIRGAYSDLDTELQELQERVKSNRQLSGQSSGFSLLKRPDVYHPVIIAMMLMVFQQFSGINAVMFYLKTIFEESSSIDSDVASIMVDSSLVVATIVAALVMDRFGRKILLLISAFGHVVSLGFMGFYYKSIEPDDGWIPVTCLMVFVIMFSFGFGPIPWMIVGEITPSEAMPVVSSLGSSTNWLLAFLITKEFEDLVDHIHNYGAYWMFAGFSAVSIIYVALCVPETKQKSIEDMQRHFRGEKKI